MNGKHIRFVKHDGNDILRSEDGDCDRVVADTSRSCVAGNGPQVKAAAISLGDVASSVACLDRLIRTIIPPAMQNRVRFIEHESKKILLTDLSGLIETGILPTLAEAAEVIRSHPPKSLLTLTDISRTTLTLRTESGEYDRVGAEGIRRSVAGNGPFVKASAIVAGDDEGKWVIMQFLNRLGGREFAVFASAEQALDWLVRQ